MLNNQYYIWLLCKTWKKLNLKGFGNIILIRKRRTIIYLRKAYKLCARLGWEFSSVCVFCFFFFWQPHNMTNSTVNSAQMHCSRTHIFHFSATFLLKIGPTILFTHLKIILLQCFQFQFSVSAKISSIQTDPYV